MEERTCLPVGLTDRALLRITAAVEHQERIQRHQQGMASALQAAESAVEVVRAAWIQSSDGPAVQSADNRADFSVKGVITDTSAIVDQIFASMSLRGAPRLDCLNYRLHNAQGAVQAIQLQVDECIQCIGGHFERIHRDAAVETAVVFHLTTAAASCDNVLWKSLSAAYSHPGGLPPQPTAAKKQQHHHRILETAARVLQLAEVKECNGIVDHAWRAHCRRLWQHRTQQTSQVTQ